MINFIISGKPSDYYISLKDRINILLGRSFITGWYRKSTDEIYINLSNTFKKYPDPKSFFTHLIQTIAHETIHRFIIKNIGEIDAKKQEWVLDKMGIGHNKKWFV